MDGGYAFVRHYVLRIFQHGTQGGRQSGKKDSSQKRVRSSTEVERLLGFPIGWTETPDVDFMTREGEHRRNTAVGNAFAVPVIARMLTADHDEAAAAPGCSGLQSFALDGASSSKSSARRRAEIARKKAELAAIQERRASEELEALET